MRKRKFDKGDIISIILAILIALILVYCHKKSIAEHEAWYVRPAAEPIPVMLVEKQIEPTEDASIEAPEYKVQEVSNPFDEDIPIDVQRAAMRWGEEYGICPELIEALAWRESRYTADAVSPDGSCIGMCQINPRWHGERMQRLGVKDLTITECNIAVACDYLADLFMEYEEPEIVLMVFNGDHSFRQGHISQYAKDILEMSQELERKHGK